MTVPPSLGKLWVGWPISAQLTEALQLPVSPNGAQTSSPFTATSASSPLLGEPGFVIPEEQLPRANHVVRVTAFVEENQVASRVVNVPTCKLTAISPLIRESGTSTRVQVLVRCVHVHTYNHIACGPQQCVSALLSSVTADHLGY